MKGSRTTRTLNLVSTKDIQSEKDIYEQYLYLTSLKKQIEAQLNTLKVKCLELDNEDRWFSTRENYTFSLKRGITLKDIEEEYKSLDSSKLKTLYKLNKNQEIFKKINTKKSSSLVFKPKRGEE